MPGEAPTGGRAGSSGRPSSLSPGVVTAVADGVRRVVAPNPGMMTGPGTNTYLIGGDRLAVLDPGPDDDGHLAALCRACEDRVQLILVTHSHLDHSPLSARLHEVTGAPVIGFAPAPSPAPGGGDAAGGLDPHDPTFTPDRLIADGDHVEVDGLRIEAVHTPGHASNHLCFEMSDVGLVFSGDHVMSGSTVVIAPPDGDMAVYMDSLEKLRSRAPLRIAPGHGEMIDDPVALLDGYLRHRIDRERQILSALAGRGPGGSSVEDLVGAVYVDVPDQLKRVAGYSVWAHLRKLADESRVAADAPDSIESSWRSLGP